MHVSLVRGIWSFIFWPCIFSASPRVIFAPPTSESDWEGADRREHVSTPAAYNESQPPYPPHPVLRPSLLISVSAEMRLRGSFLWSVMSDAAVLGAKKGPWPRVEQIHVIRNTVSRTVHATLSYMTDYTVFVDWLMRGHITFVKIQWPI